MKRAAVIAAAWMASMIAPLAMLGPVADATSPSPASGLDSRNVTGGVAITGCGDHNCRTGLVIPATIGALTVVAIAEEAFEYFVGDEDDDEVVVVGAVVLPDSVISIGASAFERQLLVTSVDVGDGVQTIGNKAFERNSTLASLTLGSAVTTIGASAFRTTGLTQLVLPDSVISVGDAAFRSGQLTSLSFGSGLHSIGNYAFANNSLSNVVLPNSLTTIGQYAFVSNPLTTVTLPASVATVGGSAFGSLPSLTHVMLEGPPPTAPDTVFSSTPNLAAVHVWNGMGYGATWGGKPTIVVLRAPTVPTGVAAVAGDGSATVSWEQPANSDALVTSYQVTASPDGAQCIWTTGPLTCEVNGLTNGTAYTFTVTATSTAGTSAASSVSATTTPAVQTVAATDLPLPTGIANLITQPAAMPTTVVAPISTTTTVPSDNGTSVAGADDLTLAPSFQAIARLPLAKLAEGPAPGAQVTVAYGGFEPGEQVLVVVASTPRVIAQAFADATGSVTLSIRIPSDLGSGSHTLAVFAPGSQRGARQVLDPSLQTLPATGSPAGVGVGVLVLALGGMFVMASRRRMGPRHTV